MTKTTIQYSGSEALEMVKEVFPTTWIEEINQAKNLIIRLRRTWKLDSYDKGYQKYISYGCRTESAIIMLAALHQLKRDESELRKSTAMQIELLRVKQDEILLQQDALESAKSIIDFDKMTLRGYYKNMQTNLGFQIQELLNTMDVDAEVLIFQTNLFQ